MFDFLLNPIVDFEFLSQLLFAIVFVFGSENKLFQDLSSSGLKALPFGQLEQPIVFIVLLHYSKINIDYGYLVKDYFNKILLRLPFF